ncbi:hypothetical protein [Rhizobium sp. BK176]|uniref:hypothetical protein n=1 Tax=Rhizobium sp. BK176 TaxID=2587071 RepID=UPI00216A0FF0|nr:hypothetical protein [Rhizobium sp. BK176]MCS4090091.1 hypothetical protein [Rhizobium sp. BK176]
MSSADEFAKALAQGFLSNGVRERLDELNRPSYAIGDGTEVALDDHLLIPERVGGPRAGQWAVVVKLSADGLGVRFQQKVGRVTREFFVWNELAGARATAAPRGRKRKTVTPPRA